MTLIKLSIGVKTLQNVPAEEVFFFLHLGRLLNEILVLHKAIECSMPSSDIQDVPRTEAQISQATFFYKILAGKLVNAWELISKQFLALIPPATRSLYLDYEPEMSEEAKIAFKRLKHFFGKGSNPIFQVRNDFAFHESSHQEIKAEVTQLIGRLPLTQELKMYLAPEEGNCLYSLHHSIFNFVMFSRYDSDIAKAIQTFTQDVITCAGEFIAFAGDTIRIFGARHFGEEEKEVQIPDPPSLTNVRLPYFISRGIPIPTA